MYEYKAKNYFIQYRDGYSEHRIARELRINREWYDHIWQNKKSQGEVDRYPSYQPRLSKLILSS
jgi:hypothetical protein